MRARAEAARDSALRAYLAESREMGLSLLLVLPLLASTLSSGPAWVFMWAMAFAIFAGCKWLTWWEARGKLRRVSAARSAAYLLAWPGMDPTPFFNEPKEPARIRKEEWWAAFLKFLFGVFVFWGLARRVPPDEPLLRGWIGLIGIIFMLHFGVFHLAALFFQSKGVAVRCLMRNPIAATSLTEFWGKRWNLAFHDLATNFVFRPLLPLLGVAGASLATFLVSGLVHELAISLPACGGFGLPTAYFLIQGLGLLLERSPLGERLGLRAGARGWLFTMLLTAGPAFWLFHPPFVHRVIVPFMEAMGAL